MELTLTAVADDYQPTPDKRFESVRGAHFEVSHTPGLIHDSPKWIRLISEARRKVEIDNYYFVEGRKYTAYLQDS